MKLEHVFAVLSSVLVVLVAVAAVALVVVTTGLQRTASGMEDAVESVRTAKDLEIALLTRRDTPDAVSRLATEERLRRLVQRQSDYVDDSEEAAAVSTLQNTVEGYLEAVDRAESDTTSLAAVQKQTGPQFDAAFGAAAALIQTNVTQSQVLERRALRWSRYAVVSATSAILLGVVGMALFTRWLRGAAFRPVVNLAAAIERYGKGEHSLRTPEEGADEFRVIAHRFNEMAWLLEAQRNRQFAFLAGVAHDLRNPLSALKLASGAIRAELPLPPEQQIRKTFVRVQRQLDRLDRMVFDLMDAARIEAGRLELQLESCDAREIVEQTVELFGPSAAGHPLVVTAPDCPVQLNCDPARLEQVLNNLVSNAIKYSRGSSPISLRVEQQPQRVLLSVADEGVGIPASELPRIFDPFERLSLSKNEVAGTGLGLFVAQRIVQAHLGHIEVQSVPGRGSTFTVHLPKVVQTEG